MLAAELQHVANSFDGPINSLRNFAMDGFELTDASRRIVEVARKPRAIVSQGMSQIAFGAVSLAAPFGYLLQSLQRKPKTPGRVLDRIGVAHPATRRAIDPLRAKHAAAVIIDYSHGEPTRIPPARRL